MRKGVYRYNPSDVIDRELEDFSPAQKAKILKRDDWKSVTCGRSEKDGVELHADHIKPKDLGGRATVDNGQTLCSKHNFLKKNLNQTETGKKMFIRLYELSTKENNEYLQKFCADILQVYEDHDINGTSNGGSSFMKLKKFRIKNYKSIIDSGDCYLTDTITILAGKNETGKTSILEALEDFDTRKRIREEAKPFNLSAKPEISVTFIIEKDAMKEIWGKIGISMEVTDDVKLEVIKSFPDQYSFAWDVLKNEKSDSEKMEELQKSISGIWDKIRELILENKIMGWDSQLDLDFSNLVKIRGNLEIIRRISENRRIISHEDTALFLRQLVSKINSELSNLENLFTIKENFRNFEEYIPNFILFNSFEDIFPDNIPLGQLGKNEWFKDLSLISNLDSSIITGSDERLREDHKDNVNITINTEYKKFWTQDASNLSVSWDSNNLFFWIKEDRHSYPIKSRSKGRQWHLAFYIKVSARANDNVRSIILIDEPGLFLHAAAQRDILRKLEDLAQKVQLIFSTHSPYLLEADKLNQVKLIFKTAEKGTTIENKVHARADKETLTPIMTAIGLELNAGISALDRLNNVIVEGPSDVYYLNAFKALINRDNLNFISGGGGNMPLIGTILQGWGGKVIYIYDNDQGKKDGEKNLKHNWLVHEDLIISVLDTKNGRIEDIFSSSDFRKFVLKQTGKTYSESNSEYVQREKLDKVLLAKNFLEICLKHPPICLDRTTTDNITRLIEKVESGFRAAPSME